MELMLTNILFNLFSEIPVMVDIFALKNYHSFTHTHQLSVPIQPKARNDNRLLVDHKKKTQRNTDGHGKRPKNYCRAMSVARIPFAAIFK